jgi:alpha-1,3-mannosyltransferase
MEIVHVIRQYKPSVGGLEDAAHNLCTTLAHMPDTKVRVITLNRVFANPETILPERENIDGIEITRIPYFGSSRYPIATSVLREIKSADIVHVHAVDFFFDFLSLFRFMHKKPLVASTHGGFFHTAFAARLKRIYFNTVTRFSCTGYKTICASSENDTATFRRIADNVITIENGVNIDKWRDAGSKTAERRLIFIGRWSANKRVPLLINLLAELRKTGQDWQLTISGLPGDDTAEGLQKLSRELSVSDAVKIVAMPSEDEIKRLIGTASYITSASSYEGFGISIIEGLSAGLLPVITPLPPFLRLLGALGEGVRIDTGNLANTAQALEAAHVKLSRNTAQTREAAMALSTHYEWGRVAKQFMDVYKTVLR